VKICLLSSVNVFNLPPKDHTLGQTSLVVKNFSYLSIPTFLPNTKNGSQN